MKKQNLIKKHLNYSIKYPQSNHLLKFGIYGIKCKTFSLILNSKLDSLHFILLKKLKKIELKNKPKIWNCLFLNLNLTKLTPESRMGKGKGTVYSNGIFVRPGTILFEFNNIEYKKMIDVFIYFSKKVSLKLILVTL